MNQIPQHIFDLLLDLEGGYILHKNEHDTGGLTYAGISYRWWSDLWIWEDHTRLTSNPDNEIRDAVREFFTEKFWTKMWLNQIDDENKAAAVFIFGVNAGSYTSIRLAQKVCYPALTSEWDGIVGNRTISGINAMSCTDFLSAFYKQCEARYDQIVAENPTQRVFREGWQNRINRVDREYNDGRMANIPLA